ncbi:hypothetical protein ACUWEX_13825 [Okibacterium fritillariae]|uniref:hypothetical protein n=1 Tax=Okibacterium fritillariae TaxID=123320 RepID=UPI0040554D31
MEALFIDPTFGVLGHEEAKFESSASFFDYDVVLWDCFGTYKRMLAAGHDYRGDPALSESLSVSLVRAIARRRIELTKFLELGRTLVLFADADRNIWVNSGKKEFSGTGRNRQTTNIVEPVGLFRALPFEFGASLGHGTNFSAADSRFGDLLRSTQGRWSYRATLTNYPGRALGTVTGTDLVIASLEQTVSGGNVVVLPAFSSPSHFDPDESDGGEPLNQLISYVNALVSVEEEDRPAWFDHYQLASEVARAPAITSLEERLASIQDDLERIRGEQAEDERRKLLISATDSVLERQVQDALESIGFRALEVAPGRGDLRMECDEGQIVVEVKGVTKSASEKHAAQLEKWSAIEIENGNEAKAILIVNAWRLLGPDLRIEEAFPDQMIAYASSRNHALITGLQLLNMSEAARLDVSLATTYREQIFVTNGRLLLDLPPALILQSHKED